MVRFHKIKNIYFVNFLVDPILPKEKLCIKILEILLINSQRIKISISKQKFFLKIRHLLIYLKNYVLKTEHSSYILYYKIYKRKI